VDHKDLRILLDYNYWARDRLYDAVQELTPEQFLRNLGSSFPSVRDTLVHIYSAEWIWLSRWKGESPSAMLKAESYPDLAAIREAWDRHEAKMREFLDNMTGDSVNRVIEYKGFSGQAAEPFWQMLQHVVNHGSYHRGQVTTMLRQLNAAPPKSLDLIAFYRAHAPELRR
jgi:uncharacterized damage-inducible protein DinB